MSVERSLLRNDDVPEPDLGSFDYDPRTRVVFGTGASNQLGTLAIEYGARKVLLVTDPGVRRAGHAEKCRSILEQQGLQVTLFDRVQPNPTTDDVQAGVEAARDGKIDFLVAVGGGSAMDCAKGINFLLTNGGEMRDYWGVGKAKQPMLPLIAVPTTSGTGSEAQSYALISDAITHVKMACGDKKAACRAAVLDPSLTLSMPFAVTAATGLDAISHAVESYVTLKKNPISQLFSRRSWRNLCTAFPAALHNPHDVDARAAMLLGAHLAGAAIENSMLGAAHALANPLTAAYGITHGLAVAVMLPHVVMYNAKGCEQAYAKLALDVPVSQRRSSGAETIAHYTAGMLLKAGGAQCLCEFGVERSQLTQLAAAAAAQWTGTFNPRPVSAESLLELYQCAWEKPFLSV